MLPAVMAAAIFGGASNGLRADDLEIKPVEVAIVEHWAGDYPVAELGRLPMEQRSLRVGYLGDKGIFAEIWRAFRPDQGVPVVDFTTQLVLFARNVDFYNRNSIVRVTLTGGKLEVVVIETMSAMPIEDRVAMALAVISREGVEVIDTGTGRIFVPQGAGSSTYPGHDSLSTASAIGDSSFVLIDLFPHALELPAFSLLQEAPLP
jgi:hypothetical protein